MRKKLLHQDDLIAQKLRLAIADKELLPGEKLPGERELARRFGVQRATLRRALAQLLQENLLCTAPRSGCRVCAPKAQVDARQLCDLSQYFAAGEFAWTGLEIAAEVLGPEAERERQLPPGQAVTTVRRVGLAGGRAVCAELWIFLGADALEPESSDGYCRLEQAAAARLRRAPVYANESIDLVYASKDQSAQLGTAPLAPLFKLVGYTYDQSGALLDYHERLLLPEAVAFVSDSYAELTAAEQGRRS